MSLRSRRPAEMSTGWDGRLVIRTNLLGPRAPLQRGREQPLSCVGQVHDARAAARDGRDSLRGLNAERSSPDDLLQALGVERPGEVEALGAVAPHGPQLIHLLDRLD